MKNCLPSIFLAWALLAAGQGHALPIFPDTAQDSSTSSPSPSPSGLGPVHTDGKCHFRLKESPDEGYTHKAYMFYANKQNPNGWGFGFTCYAGASQDDIDGQLGAKKVDGQWISLDYAAPFVPEQNFETMDLTGKNWKGRIVAYDMITGPEETRARFFNFCLVEDHGPQVLCGQVQGLSAGTINTEIKTKKIMDVIKTIEFVDLPSGQPASSQSISR